MKSNYLNKEYRETAYLKQILSQRKSRLKRLHNITLEQYEALYNDQKGLCALCNEPQASRLLSVDQNKATLEIYGLLCIRCNFLIKDARNGTYNKCKNLFRLLTKYLAKTSTTHIR